MVAIVSGNSLGLDLTSWRTLGSFATRGDAAHGTAGEQAFVNVATGNLVLQRRDEVLAARGDDVQTVRTYNSQGLLDDDNADNWVVGLALRPLRVEGTLNAPGSTVTRTGRDGGRATYAWDPARNAYLTTEGDGAHDTLVHLAADGQFEWRDGSSGVTERYAGAGDHRLLAQRDAAGNVTTYGYTADGLLAQARTAAGDATCYDWSGRNLVQVRNVLADGSTSTAVRYGYDALNRLSSVTVDLSPDDNSVADGRVHRTSYTYDGGSARLAGVVQADGTRLAFTYVLVGGTWRIATVAEGPVTLLQLTYASTDPAAAVTTVRSRSTLDTRYEVDAASRLVAFTATAPDSTTVLASQRYGYTAAGDLATVVDGEGRQVSWAYDAAGNPVLQRGALGSSLAQLWTPSGLLSAEIGHARPDPDGDGPLAPLDAAITRRVHDAAGRRLLRFELGPQGSVLEYRYDGWGQRTSEIRHDVDGRDLLAQAALDEGQVQAWLAAQGSRPAERTDLAYDARGLLASRTRYARLDAAGEGVCDGSESVEAFVHDARGRLLQAVSATGARSTQVVDGLGRVTVSTDPLGAVTSTSYDDGAMSVTVTGPLGLVTTTTTSRDAAGAITVREQASAGGVVLATSSETVDPWARMRIRLDATSQRSFVLYDALGRKTADIDPTGMMVEYAYDRSGLLALTTRYATSVPPSQLSTLAAAASLLTRRAQAASYRPASSSVDQREWRNYDAEGRLVRVASSVPGAWAAVAVTQHTYDGMGRRVASTAYARAATLSSSGIATIPLPVAQPGADRTWRYFHDGEGRQVGALDPEGFLQVTRRDAAGRAIGTTAYATPTVAALRATADLAALMPPAGSADVRTWSLYNGKGQLAAEVDAERYLTEYVYDADGREVRSIRYASQVRADPDATRDLVLLRPAPSPADRVTEKAWDGAGRLVRQVDARGTVTAFSHDLAGRLVATHVAAGTPEVRSLLARYDALGRMVAELSAEGAARLTGGQTSAEVDAVWAQWGTTHAYDAAGRRVSSTDAAGARTWFFYTRAGQLSHTVNALGEVQEQRYNARGMDAGVGQASTRISTLGLAGGVVGTPNVPTVGTSRSYERDGLLSAQTDALGQVTRYERDVFGGVLRVTDPQNVATTSAFDRRGLQTSTVSDSGVTNAGQTFEHDAFGRLVRSTDAAGAVRTWAYDRLGRVVAAGSPDGVRRTTYDAFGQVLAQVDELGRTTTYTHDVSSGTVAVRTPQGLVTTTERDRHGQVVRITDPRGTQTSYRYDRAGRLVDASGATGRRTASHDAAGRVLAEVDEAGVRTTYTYDAAHRVLTRILDPEGLALVTRYQYDAWGRTVSVTDPAGRVTTTSYDARSRVLAQVVDAGGLALQTTYTYDAGDRVLTVTEPDGRVTQTGYDRLGRRVSEVVDPAGVRQTRGWAWNKAGHLLASTDGVGARTLHVNDAMGRPVYTIDPAGGVQQTAYDAAGRVVRTVRHVQAIALATLPAAPTAADIQSRLVPQPAADVVEHRVWDADGRLLATIDGTGAVVRWTYDAAGNVTERRAYAQRIDLAGWTPGTLPQPAADDARDERLRTVYDAADRPVWTVDGTGALVQTAYDAAGRVAARTAYARSLPPGSAIDAASLAQAAGGLADPARDQASRFRHDAAGRLVWSADGTGAVTTRLYDTGGRLVRTTQHAQRLGAGAAPGTVPPAGPDRVTSLAYDSAGREVFRVDALGAVTEQVLDAAGRVVRQVAYANTVPAALGGTPLSAAALRAALAPDASRDRIERRGYDSAGQLVLQVDALGALTETWWDGAGRAVARCAYAEAADPAALQAATSTAALRLLLRPDAARDRVQRTGYDAAGRVQVEVDGTGAATSRTHDGAGRLLQLTRHANLLPTSGLGSTGAALRAAIAPSADDRTLVHAWDAGSRLLARTDALGQVERWTYDAVGRRTAWTNQLGATWTYDHDAAGRLVQETSPEVELAVVPPGQAAPADPWAVQVARVVTLQAWDALGQLVQRTEAAGRPEERTTRHGYDAAGRRIRTVYPLVGVYNPAGEDPSTNGTSSVAVRIESAVLLESRTWHDAFGDVVAERDVGGALRQQARDVAGRVTYEVDPLGQVTGYARNAFGDTVALTRYATATPLAQRDPGVSRPATAGEVAGVLAGVDHAADRVLTLQVDAAGRVVEVREPVAFVHDASEDDPAARLGWAGKTTRTTYDAFGQVVEVALLRNPVRGTWDRTWHWYDRAGRQTATVDALGYLTTRSHDALGNLLQRTEYASALAAGSWSRAGHGLPAAQADDRTVRWAYDRLGRQVSETRVAVEYSPQPDGQSVRGDLVTRTGWDATGRQAWTTDALGTTTRTWYDALGRVRATTGATRNQAGSGRDVVPLQVFRRDAHGNALATIAPDAGATAATDQGWSTDAPGAGERITRARYDALGRQVEATDPTGAAQSTSYDAWGHVAKQWRGVTGLDGVTRTLWEVQVHDAAGQLVRTVAPGPADLAGNATAAVVTALDYNAFGELTRRGTPGEWQEYFDLDAAGRVWRTNTGDGLDRIRLYDAQGRVTREISSVGASGVDIDVRRYASADAAAGEGVLRHRNTVYDSLGRVVRTADAPTLEPQGGATVATLSLAASVLASAAPAVDESGTVTGWSGSNRLQLAWPGLAALGPGDLRVQVDFRAWRVQGSIVDESGARPASLAAGDVQSRTFDLDGAGAAHGTTLAWDSPAQAQGGIARVVRVLVFKRDLAGAWQVALDLAPGSSVPVLEVPSPADPGSRLHVQVRAAGGTWAALPGVEFGDRWRAVLAGWADGAYEYQADLATVDGQVRPVGAGTFSIAAQAVPAIGVPLSLLDAGVVFLRWPSPDADTVQELRTRPSGSSGAWTLHDVLRGADPGHDVVRLDALPAGEHGYELVWSTRDGTPVAHATGRILVVPPQPGVWVPAQNLPPIGGVALGQDVVGATVVGHDENGVPLLAGGTQQATLGWQAAGAHTFRYRVPGGGWAQLAVDSSAQGTDEAGRLVGRQFVVTTGLPPGTYEFEVLAAGAQATGVLTIHASSPGSWHTVTVQVPVTQPIVVGWQPVYETRWGSRQVQQWVRIHEQVVTGYTEDGQPIYDVVWRDELRWVTEHYSWQELVGHTPVYATDESGNTLYETVYVPQQQQVWVQGTTPAPSLALTTPAYVPGYMTPATPTRYGLATDNASPALLSQSGRVDVAAAARADAGDRWTSAIVHTTRDRWGNALSVSDPRSAAWVTTFRYDAFDQVVQETRPDPSGGRSAASPVTLTFHDALGRTVATRDANGNLEARRLDAAGQVLQELHADGGVVQHRYDVHGNRVESIDAEGHWTRYEHDRAGRLTATVHQPVMVHAVGTSNWLAGSSYQSLVERWTYDQAGRRLSAANGAGETVRYGYDLRGNVVATWQPMGHLTRSAWDAQGRKIAERDAAGVTATWQYDYFGQLLEHRDRGAAAYRYQYDHARLLVAQSNERGQLLRYAYDTRGQLLSIRDELQGKLTTYAYDQGGRRVRERTVQGGIVYQDNHLAYDALGRLRDVADARVHMQLAYDNAGNRTRVTTWANYQGPGGARDVASDRWFRYDAMHRQVVVDGVDAAGNLGTQGHALRYDRNGNRVADTSWGNRVVVGGGQQVLTGFDESGVAIYGQAPVTYTRTEGWAEETYHYDTMDRLQSVVRDGVQLEARLYDGAGRVVVSGPVGGLPAGYAQALNEGVRPAWAIGLEQRIQRYDANGRLLHQKVLDSEGRARSDTSWDPGEAHALGIGAWQPQGYDGAGNALGWTVQNWEGQASVTRYATGLAHDDADKPAWTSATSSAFQPATSNYVYDANGHLVGVTDSAQPANNRTFVNDANGVALWASQAGHVQRQLVVNGEVLGLYGIGVDPLQPASGRERNPNFADLADFNFGYARISASHPSPGSGSYQVRPGDTLRGIARAVYGDSSRWDVIALANGLGSDDDLKAGHTLQVPATVSGLSNDESTFLPYDPQRLQGDLSPTLVMPMPAGSSGGCGGVGDLIVLVVAIAVSAAAPQVLQPVLGKGFAAATAGAAIGSAAGQLTGMALGQQRAFSWKQVALAAVGGGLAHGMPVPGLQSPVAANAMRLAAGNVLTQGVATALEVQRRFEWRAVAAAVVGSLAAGATGGATDELGGSPGRGAGVARGILRGMMVGVTSGLVQGRYDALSTVLRSAMTSAIADRSYGDSGASRDEGVHASHMGLDPSNVSEGLQLPISIAERWKAEVDGGISTSTRAIAQIGGELQVAAGAGFDWNGVLGAGLGTPQRADDGDALRDRYGEKLLNALSNPSEAAKGVFKSNVIRPLQDILQFAATAAGADPNLAIAEGYGLVLRGTGESLRAAAQGLRVPGSQFSNSAQQDAADLSDAGSVLALVAGIPSTLRLAAGIRPLGRAEPAERVFAHLGESRAARESSNFEQFVRAEGRVQADLQLWPPNRGAYAPDYNWTLSPGAEVDRFGLPRGRFVSPTGEPFGARSLPPDYEISKPYFQYEVMKPVPGVVRSKALPWFGQPGRGTQYDLPESVQWYLDHGYMRRK